MNLIEQVDWSFVSQSVIDTTIASMLIVIPFGIAGGLLLIAYDAWKEKREEKRQEELAVVRLRRKTWKK